MSQSELELLAVWLHLAADETGQVEVVRSLIRRAHATAIEMYGIPSAQVPCEGDHIVETLGQFAGLWDEDVAIQSARLHDSAIAESTKIVNGSSQARDLWNFTVGSQAARINELLNIDQFRTVNEIYDILVCEFATTTVERVRSHVYALKKKHPGLLKEKWEGNRVSYQLLKPSNNG